MQIFKTSIRLLSLILIGILIGALWSSFTITKTELVHIPNWESQSKKMNILFLSFCSLRKEKIDLYHPGNNQKITPNIDNYFKNAFLFKNAYSSFGWTNMALYFPDKISESTLSSFGYTPIGLDNWKLFSRIPKDLLPSGEFSKTPELFNNKFKNELEELKNSILESKKRPFFLFAHFKYLHFPYIDNLNKDTHWQKYLNTYEVEKVQNILSNTTLQLKKPLLYIALTGNYKSVESLPDVKKNLNYKEIQNSFFSIYDIFSDENLVNKWKQQPDYNEDLRIIDKIYSAKLNYFDNELKDLFDLYGNKELQDNTVIILTGDHGEALMQHNILGHASHVYDEIITHPLLVRFPAVKQITGTTINNQFYQGSFTDISKKLMSGALNHENFIQELALNSDQNQNIISRNCANSIQSVRQDNHWKYISDFKSNQRFLYDISNDPDETKNIIDSNTDTAEILDLYLKLHRNRINQILDLSPCKNNSFTRD